MPGPLFQQGRKLATIGRNAGFTQEILLHQREAAMKTSFKLYLAVLAVGLAVPTAAFALEAGIREVPAKAIAVPTSDVSPQEQALIGAPLPPFWNDHPKDAAEWKTLIKARADAIIKTLPACAKNSASSPSR